MIGPFRGRYSFLSNFHPVMIRYDGVDFPTVEHAYQAIKTTDRKRRRKIATAPTPVAAKHMGKRVQIRRNWNSIKVSVMRELLRRKFAHPELRALLLATGKKELVEINRFGDRFWGVCGGTGQNHLGKILMDVRREISSKQRTA
jgi:N-glycosidase YbiA